MKFLSLSVAVGLSSQVFAMPISLEDPLSTVGQTVNTVTGTVEGLVQPVTGSLGLGLKKKDITSTVQGVEGTVEGVLANPLGTVGSTVDSVESTVEGLVQPVTGSLGLGLKKKDVTSTVQGVQGELTSALSAVSSLKNSVEAELDTIRMITFSRFDEYELI